MLGNLLTKPRTTYLARIRNPNKAMPDYYDRPYSYEEFEQHHGKLFESEPAHEAAAKGHS